MDKPLYTGQPLADNEFLLKVADNTGFLTKLTKKGELPKAFEIWRDTYHKKANLPIYIHTETPKEGWRLVEWRIGQSQEWATMMHPDGFTVEIYLRNFLQIALNNTIEKGVIKGFFMWEANRLKQF